MNRISYASTSSSTSYSSSLPSPFSRSNIDRDAIVQRALLGENAYLDELETPSPIATPSPVIKQLSPLSRATHLNAVENPFLDSAEHYERDAAAADRWPIAITASTAAPLKQHTRQAQHHRSLPRSSFMTSSGTGLLDQDQFEHASDARLFTASQAPRNVESSSSPVHLPTIQETATRVSPPVPPRRRTKPTGMTSYPLPPSTDLPKMSAQIPTWRRPSVFPLGPVPPPLPPRRIRSEPQPHIVDIAVERFKINTHTLSSPSPSPSTPTSSKSAQQEERERQWEKWETERIRAQQMTTEAAKNNRIFAPRSNASSSSGNSRAATSTAVSISEKVKPAPVPSVKKTKKRSWWCFGGGAVESDTEEDDEKSQYSREQQQQQRQRRSVASLDAIEVDEEEEDESEDARASSHGTGLLGFSCSKSSSSRKGATLKKKSQ